MENHQLSIIICTYNRSRLLKKCLDSLLPQLTEELEIVIIDNNSPDDTALVVREYIKKHKNIRYVCEPEIGLSHARNRGIKEAKADWILYIDDDAIAFPDLIERALYLIERADFDCVGGMYYGYFEGEKPKWIPKDFGTKYLFSASLCECPFNVPHGGIVIYRKSILYTCGGFNTTIGMSANKISYGEEIYLQKRIEDLHGKIGFDPKLKVYHLNKADRLSLKNMFVFKYELGKSHKFEITLSLTERLYRVGRSILGIPKHILTNLVRLLISRNYFWQNLLFDSFGPFIYYLGRL